MTTPPGLRVTSACPATTVMTVQTSMVPATGATNPALVTLTAPSLMSASLVPASARLGASDLQQTASHCSKGSYSVQQAAAHLNAM